MLLVRDACPNDVPRLLEIYNDAVLNTNATFDIHPQTLEQRQEWFSHYGGAYALLVAEDDGQVVGYASLSRYRPKPAYGHTVESSVYVDKGIRGKGIGTALMTELLKRAAAAGHHTVLAGVVGDNQGSIRLHERLGFRLTGTLREVGYKFGIWHNVSWYQLML